MNYNYLKNYIKWWSYQIKEEVNLLKENHLKLNIKYKKKLDNIEKKLKNKQKKWKLVVLNIKVLFFIICRKSW